MVSYRRHLYTAVIGLVLLTAPALSRLGCAATGDILAVRIASAAAHNGYVAEIDIDNLATGGTYAFGLTDSGYSTRNDPAAAKIVFTVTSLGYDTGGGATTITRTVYGTYWMRKAYPNATVADEGTSGSTLTVRVVLSDYIYASDTATVTIASGFYTKTAVPNNPTTAMSVTVNSTQTYPKSVCRWATVPYQQITGDFIVETTCFNRHFQAFKPLAAVIFSCADTSSHTVSVTVNKMFPSPKAAQYGDQQKVLTYAATIPVSTLTQANVLTCNFIAYPWVGDSGALVDTSTGVSDNEALGPLLLLNDKSGTYGGAFALIDATNGHNSTASTWVYSSQATAESNYASSTANSYTTIGNAVQAIQSFNNSNYSRNEPGGGVALLTGNHTYTTTIPGSALNAQNTWFTITRLSTVARSSAAINAGTSSSVKIPKIRFYDININISTSEFIVGTVGTDQIWLDADYIDSAAGLVIAWKRGYATGNSIVGLSGGFTSFSTNKSPWALIRGNLPTSGTINGALYTMLGNKNIKPLLYERGNAPGQLIADNAIMAFNTLSISTGAMFDAWGASCAGNADQVIGWAMVQNVIERYTNDANPLMTVGLSDGCSTTNILLWYNTLSGQRENLGYNSTGSTPYYRWMWSMIGNIFDDWNNKGDNFATENSARVGGWPVEHNVGSAGNVYPSAGFPPTFHGLYMNNYPVGVDGTDALAYAATAKHTSASGNRPITGGSYTSSWTQRGNAATQKNLAWVTSTVYGPQGFFLDRSASSGTAAGSGSYWMTAGTGTRANGVGLGLLPKAYRPLPYDLSGRPRNTGAAGAYEPSLSGKTQ